MNIFTAVPLDKSSVGLDQVDNTSDATKNAATATLTNKTIDGDLNTLQDIPQSAVTGLGTALGGKVDTSAVGATGGVASLDGNGKVPGSQLPNSIMTYEGLHDVSANSPALTDATGEAGQVYRVSVAGSRDYGSGSLSLEVGDYLIHSGSVWQKADTTDAVSSVAGRTGNITLTKSDVGLGNVDNTSDATKDSAATTLTNKTITSPRVNQLLDTSGNPLLVLTPGTGTPSAIAAASNSSGDTVQFMPSSSLSNVNLNLRSLGGGAVFINGVQSVTTSGTQTLTNKTLTSPKITQINDVNGNAVLWMPATASAVNYLRVDNNASGNPVTLYGWGDDTNISLNLVPKGTGTVKAGGVDVVTTTGTQSLTNKTLTNATLNACLYNRISDSSGNRSIVIGATASAVNHITVNNAATGNAPSIAATSTTDTNVGLNLVPLGSGTVQANGVDVVTVSGTQSLTNKTIQTPVITDQNGNIAASFNTGLGSGSVDYLRFESGNGGVRIGVSGTSTDAGITYRTKGNGWHVFQTPAINALLVVGATGTVNASTIEASVSGSPVRWTATGSDTNVGINLVPKGTGTVQAGGVPVVTTTGTQTLSNKTLSSPTLSNGILKSEYIYTPGDAANIPSARFTTGYNAAGNNIIWLAARNAGSPAAITVHKNGSTDTNVGIALEPLGSGAVQIYGATGQTPTLAATGADTNHNLNLTSKGSGTVQANGVQVADVSSAQTLTNKTISGSSNTLTNIGVSSLSATGTPSSTTYLRGDGTWAAVSAGTSTPTASTTAQWDANANLSADAFIPLTTSTATAAGTTTLTIGSSQVQVFTGSTTQTVKLPTTSVTAGQSYTIVNQSTGAVTVQSSGANTVATLAANTTGIFYAVATTPTTAAHWIAEVNAAGKTLTASNSLTLAGTDGTTMTFPSSSDTVVCRDTTDTLTNKTLTTPTLTNPGLTATASGTTAGRLGYLSGTLTYGTGSVQRTVVNTDEAQTLTNKRVNPRIDSITSSATPSINTDTTDQFNITALAAAITSVTVTGTPVDGQKLMVRIKDNGTARAITWGSSFVSSGTGTLLATTAASKTHHVALMYDSTAAKWVCLASDAVGY